MLKDLTDGGRHELHAVRLMGHKGERVGKPHRPRRLGHKPLFDAYLPIVAQQLCFGSLGDPLTTRGPLRRCGVEEQKEYLASHLESH